MTDVQTAASHTASTQVGRAPRPARSIDSARTGNVGASRRLPAGKRPHVAAGGRVVAAGFGVASMLGLVGIMGLHQASTNVAVAPTAVPEPALPVAQNAVLVGTIGSGVTGVVQQAGQPIIAQQVAAQPVAGQQTTQGPIVLSAQPVVRQAAPSAAPRAKSNGSR